MTLDPATAAYLDDLAAAGGTPYEDMASAEEARAAYRDVVARRMAGVQPPFPPCATEDFQVEGLWMRSYRPLHRSVYEPPLPLVVYFHGGGWVIGDVDTHDVPARAFAAMPAIVLSVDYRLAPEHRYPAAHDDAFAAVTFAASELGKGFNADRLVVAGDSAGGLLAAAAALRCRDEGGPALAAQCLVYPAMDPSMGSRSHEELAEGYGLTRESMRWFYDAYGPAEGFSPTEAEDLAGLPPAVIATAGYDLLRDDGLAYGDRLREAGVPTVSLDFPGLIHAFFGMSATSPAALAAMTGTVGALSGLLR